MNWGKWIVVAFILFAGFIATLVTVCMRQDVNLVSANYYKEELNYQEQIHRMNNVSELQQKPTIEKSGNLLIVKFDQLKNVEKGDLTLFSSADPRRDRRYTLTKTESDSQAFELDNVATGVYRAKMQWVMSGKEYYMETVIYN